MKNSKKKKYEKPTLNGVKLIPEEACQIACKMYPGYSRLNPHRKMHCAWVPPFKGTPCFSNFHT